MTNISNFIKFHLLEAIIPPNINIINLNIIMKRDLYCAGRYMGYIIDNGSIISGYDNLGNYIGYYSPESNYSFLFSGEMIGDGVSALEGYVISESMRNNSY